MARQTLWTAAVAIALAVGTAMPSQAQGQGRRGRGFGGGGTTQLLRMPEVQKELKLEAAQIELLNALQRPQINRQEFQSLSPEQRRERFQQIRAEQEKKIAEILNKDQMTRLKQLQLQRQGVRALSQPEVANALKLSADQKSKIEAIRQEERSALQGLRGNGQSPEDRRAAFEKIRATRQANEAKLLGVLTDAQKKQFEAMQGPKFTFPERGRGRRRGNNAGNA